MTTWTVEELNERIAALDEQHPDFSTIYTDVSCCPGCNIPYDEWSIEKQDAYRGYESLWWLRGDPRRHI